MRIRDELRKDCELLGIFPYLLLSGSSNCGPASGIITFECHISRFSGSLLEFDASLLCEAGECQIDIVQRCWS